MNDWQLIAKMLKTNNSNQGITASTGVITNTNPLTIQLNEYILLDVNKLIITEYFNNLTKNINDKVLLIATADTQKFFVVDKVV
jgi:hypothetical protein